MSDSDAYDRLIARNYDAAYAVARDPTGDAAFYRALAHEVGGPVLELGCGTGRILLPIARDGIECVGLDNSAAMLDELRANGTAGRPAPGAGSHGVVRSGRRALPARHLPVPRLLASPRRRGAAGHAGLRPPAPRARGVFALDVFDPDLARMAIDEEPEHLAITYEEGGQRVERWDTIRRDRARQLLEVDFRYTGGPPELTGTVTIQMRWFHRFELEHLLARAGFTDLRFFRSFDREPWTPAARPSPSPGWMARFSADATLSSWA